jgi:hypothetical protein
MLGVALVIAHVGAGSLSLDALMARRSVDLRVAPHPAS